MYSVIWKITKEIRDLLTTISKNKTMLNFPHLQTNTDANQSPSGGQEETENQTMADVSLWFIHMKKKAPFSSGLFETSHNWTASHDVNKESG